MIVPTEQTVIPRPRGLSQTSASVPSADPNVLQLESVTAGPQFQVTSHKTQRGKEAGREGRGAGGQAGFSTSQNSMLVFQRMQQLL